MINKLTRFVKVPLRLLLCAVTLSFLFSASLPATVFASHTRDIRFRASWVSGNTGTKTVYYVLDDGSSHSLGTVAKGSSGDFSFTVTFDESVRVYVRISDSAVYHERLYVNGDEVSSGDVGNEGLTYTIQNDRNVVPTGRIISPAAGATITQCPLYIGASVTTNSSGINWLVYSAYYGGAWHQIATDNSTSSSKGYSTNWNCSAVTDSRVTLRISARDNNGNEVDGLGGDVAVNMATSMSGPAAPPTIPVTSDTVAPSGRITSPAAGITVGACPLSILADVTDAGTGVAWVNFWAYYDNSWHEISHVTAASPLGWSAAWDCSAVANQNVQLGITAQDNAGNQVLNLGLVPITLTKSVSATPTVTPTPAPPTTPLLPTKTPAG